MPLSLRTLEALLPFGRPLGLLTGRGACSATGCAMGRSGGGAAGLGTNLRGVSKFGNISDIQPTKREPGPFASPLSGNRPSGGGGASGTPPKKARALQNWSTTVDGGSVRSSVKSRACSNLTSGGVRGSMTSPSPLLSSRGTWLDEAPAGRTGEGEIWTCKDGSGAGMA